MMKKKLLAAVMLLCAALLLTGCAKEEKADVSLYVNVIDNYVLDDARAALETELTAALPALNTADARLSVLAISSGDSESDPMGTMAGMTQIAGLIASSEMELIICDSENAKRHGDNGENFILLDQLFTAEEQSILGIVPMRLPLTDDEGNASGEMSAPCGVDLSGCTRLTELLGTTDVGAYVIVSTKHVDNAKTVIEHLLTMK